ncbi:hypothetical protein LSH36_1353g00016 [Paralvinella palmiformis]|uniref:Uncharacterized protein n=1 Tax=Paralvinella palmiformis TaxID=53620 RepID=A0AAD9MQV5_9ANNE|nr:hypothetical protein LSH36_1353g00016 [Paralvinella palmiformis]
MRDVRAVTAVFQEMGNLFLENTLDLLVLDTRKQTSMAETVYCSSPRGSFFLTKFVEERLELCMKPVTDTLPKNKLPLFRGKLRFPGKADLLHCLKTSLFRAFRGTPDRCDGDCVAWYLWFVWDALQYPEMCRKDRVYNNQEFSEYGTHHSLSIKGHLSSLVGGNLDHRSLPPEWGRKTSIIFIIILPQKIYHFGLESILLYRSAFLGTPDRCDGDCVAWYLWFVWDALQYPEMCRKDRVYNNQEFSEYGTHHSLSRNVAVTDDATSSSAIGIENPAPANDSEANDVGCQTDRTKEDELLGQYQSNLLSRNEEVYRLKAKHDTLARMSKVDGFDVIFRFVILMLMSLRPFLYRVIKSRLQGVQNSAARLITRTRKREHITSVLKSLHWLPVVYRPLYKLLMYTYKVLNSTTPVYLEELVIPYHPRRSLISESGCLLCVPKTSTATYRNDSASQLPPCGTIYQ